MDAVVGSDTNPGKITLILLRESHSLKNNRNASHACGRPLSMELASAKTVVNAPFFMVWTFFEHPEGVNCFKI